MADPASQPNIQVRLETEAPNPQFFLGKPGNRVELTRSEDGTAWTASITSRLPADPIPFRLELGEAVGATWTLSIRSGDDEVYRTYGQLVAPTSKWIGEIHHAHTATRAAAPPRPPIAVRNETAYRVLITARESGGSTSALQLPPWGERTMTADEAAALDLEPWTSRSIVRAGPIIQEPDLIPLVLAGLGLGIFGVSFYAGLIWLIWRLFGEPDPNYWTWAFALALIAAAIGPFIGLARAGVLGSVVRRAFSRLSWVPSLISVGATLLIAFGLPAVFMVIAEGCCYATPGANLDIRQFGPWLETLLGRSPTLLMGRVLQLLLIGTLSILPALLYYIFDRRKLSGLRERFFRSVVQLDPAIRTLEDARSVYGGRVDEVLGPSAALEGLPRIQFSRQLIILVSTLVITLGWIIAIDPQRTMLSAGSGELSLFQFIAPQRDALTFAFLGGYAFAIVMLFRRYIRSDLKPEAFANIVVRIVTAVLITWALTQLPMVNRETEVAAPATPDSTLQVTAAQREPPATSSNNGTERTPHGILLAIVFLVGFFPDWGLTVIREFIQKRIGSRAQAVDESKPLELLDGINIYHRTRLMDEGVDNLENLAHADVIDLMLGTRIPLETLLDWIDQAILLLHVSDDTDAKHLTVLRNHGIRTATDLERALEQASARKELAQFVALLGRQLEGPPRLQVILDAIADDLWMPQLRRVRANRAATGVITADLLPHWDQGETVFLERIASAQGAAGRSPAPAGSRAQDLPARV